MCACRCGIRVHLRNGEVRYIEGNPDHPLNKGVICAKGSSGIMKQYSPARLTKPLMRKPGTERGAGEFVEIGWDEAFSMLEERLAKIRATDPKRFALFTGRDQMQALTGLFARQFGTPNYAAHGGFCSVNMAAGMIYTIGGSFWEFGGPDLERAKLFVMIGTAEDHHSNPLKIAISKFKRDGGRFISINPIRTGYSAIADDWLPIKPGTDGALLLALIHEMIALGLYDREFLVRYTNAGQLVNMDEANDEFGMFVRTEVPKEEGCFDPQNKLWWDRATNRPVVTHSDGADPFLLGEFRLSDGTAVKPAFQLLKERVEDYTPEWAAGITGIPAEAIRRLAHEMGITARDEKIELPIPWTDMWGKEHDTVTGNPVAFHAMRGLAAHSNGFHTIRALAILMTLLGTIDRPGGFRHKAPFPRPIPPCAKTPNTPLAIKPNHPLDGLALGWPAEPDDLFVNDDGTPVRIDKAFSWEYPLAVHGMMHNVITNAWRGDPYPDRHAADLHGQHGVELDDEHVGRATHAERQARGWRIQDSVPRRLRRVPVGDDGVRRSRAAGHDVSRAPRRDVDARPADLGVRRSGRFGAHSRRPADGRVQAVPGSADRARRPPQVPGVRAAGRHAQVPRLSGFHRQLRDGAGIGHRLPRRLARQGRRKIHARRAESAAVGDVRAEQLRLSVQAAAVLPVHAQLEQGLPRVVAAQSNPALRGADPDPPVLRGAAEVPPRRAGQGHLAQAAGTPEASASRRTSTRCRSTTSRSRRSSPIYTRYPLNAVTQRPMAMYHSWDSQNAWLRQIHAHNHLFVNPKVARAAGIEDGGWMWVESPWGKVRCLCSYSEAVEPGTVWTWNAIGKAPGAWRLAPDANESQRGFLLNHLISEELPDRADGGPISNSDPITGQAAWYDVRVRIYRPNAGEPKATWPQFATRAGGARHRRRPPRRQAFFAGRGARK